MIALCWTDKSTRSIAEEVVAVGTPMASRLLCSWATSRINWWPARSSSQRKNARNSCRVRTATPAAKAMGSIDLRFTSERRPRIYFSKYAKVLSRPKQWRNCRSNRANAGCSEAEWVIDLQIFADQGVNLANVNT
ncbi:MAG TPA: hypothetical protein VMW24_12365 [Sedimentisphaerales bacterium]|nr:hypothetical protein [Sedimentisphaerales bacterium]